MKTYFNKISKKQWIVLLLSIILFLLSYVIKYISQINIDYTTAFYSEGFYKYYITFLSKINTLVSFSIAEVLIVSGFILAIVFLIFFIRALIFKRKQIFSLLLALIFTISLVSFLFTISYIPNYYRYSFTSYSGLTTTETSTENLYNLCVELALNANEYRSLVNQDDEVFSYLTAVSTDELFTICTDSYKNLIEDYPSYDGLFDVIENAKAKPVLLSEIMSYLKINGFFFGLTGEANINIHTSDIYIPSTVCHELAHVAGFMSEDEANFISFLACRSSDNQLLNYSGTMLALLHSTNALYSKSSDLYFNVMSMLSSDVILDINAHSEYYNYYDTSIGDFSNSVNDTYLKANNQDDGIASYGKMVDLLIADYNYRHTGE